MMEFFKDQVPAKSTDSVERIGSNGLGGSTYVVRGMTEGQNEGRVVETGLLGQPIEQRPE